VFAYNETVSKTSN